MTRTANPVVWTTNQAHKTPEYYVSGAGYRLLMRWYDRAVAKITAAHESHFVPTRFGNTHLITAGHANAPPVLLLHGINTNAAVWRPQINFLAASHRVCAPDVVGFAGKSAATRLPYHDCSYGRWAVDLLDILGLDRVDLIGASAGGHFALKLAACAPERVSRLILMNPCGIVPYRFPFYLSRGPGVTRLLSWIGRHLASPEMAQRLVRKGIAPHLPLDAERVEFSYLMLRYFRRHLPPGPLSEAELRRVTAPTLLMVGEFEVFCEPRAIFARAQRCLPGLAATALIPDAGHDMNIDQAEVVNEQVLSFLRPLGNTALSQAVAARN